MPYEYVSLNYELQDMTTLLPTPQGEMSEEERWNTLRRCSKCRLFYTELQNQEPTSVCQYHTGEYARKTLSKDELHRWTCCRDKQGASERDLPGCRQARYHTEDTVFTQNMRSFPYDPKASTVEQLKTVLDTPTPNPTVDVNNPPSLDELAQHPDFFAHMVSVADTLQGLSIRYHTSTEVIRRVNRLKTNNVFERKIVYIPKSHLITTPIPQIHPVNTNASKLANFVTKTGCAKEEAKFYLESADWDLEQALVEWKDDMAWQSKACQNPNSFPALQPTKKSPSPTRLC